MSSQPPDRNGVGPGAETSTETGELGPRRLREEMKCHQQLAVVGEDNKHMAVRIDAVVGVCAVHEALMALEELVRVSVPVGHESSDAVEL